MRSSALAPSLSNTSSTSWLASVTATSWWVNSSSSTISSTGRGRGAVLARPAAPAAPAAGSGAGEAQAETDADRQPAGIELVGMRQVVVEDAVAGQPVRRGQLAGAAEREDQRRRLAAGGVAQGPRDALVRRDRAEAEKDDAGAGPRRPRRRSPAAGRSRSRPRRRTRGRGAARSPAPPRRFRRRRGSATSSSGGVGRVPSRRLSASGSRRTTRERPAIALLHFCDGHVAVHRHQVRGPGSLALAPLPARRPPLTGGPGAAAAAIRLNRAGRATCRSEPR